MRWRLLILNLLFCFGIPSPALTQDADPSPTRLANISRDVAQKTPQEQHELLLRIAEGLNSKLPQPLDEMTTMTNIHVEGDLTLVYVYQLGLDKAHANFSAQANGLRQKATKYFCTEGAVIAAMKADVVYRYEDDKGQPIGDVIIRTRDCPSQTTQPAASGNDEVQRITNAGIDGAIRGILFTLIVGLFGALVAFVKRR